MSETEIIVPASTSNLGASFDTCGLALSLYLRVEVDAGTMISVLDIFRLRIADQYRER